MRRLLAVELAAVAALTLVAALGFGRVFSGSGHLGPVVGAVVVPVLISAAGRARRTTAASSLLWSCVGFVVYTLYAALGDTAPNVVPTAASLRELTAGLTEGWADLLTMSLPVPVQPRLLVAVLALTWAAAALGAEFAHRSRSSVAPVVPALLFEVAVLGFAAPRRGGSVWPAVGLTVAVLVVLLVHANRATVLERSRREDDDDDAFDSPRPVSVDRSAERWTLLGVPIVATTALVAGLAVTRVPAVRDPFDPRRFRDLEVVGVDTPNPLDGLKAELTLTPEAPPIRFRFAADDNPDSPDAVDRVRLTVLDRFDGAGWSSSGTFARSGPTLPAVDPASGPDGETVRVTQRVTIEALAGPWLPAADRPISLGFAGSTPGLGVDDDTGVVIVTDAGLDGLTYTVVSDVPRRSRVGRATTESGMTQDDAALTAVAGMPVGLRQLAQRLAEPSPTDTTPYARLVRLQDALVNGYGYSEDVPSGSSYARLSRFLDADRAGYAEQFAAAFAVMARSLGYPTRLVYGYLVTDTAPGGAAVRLTDITSRQAHVWPEVLLAEGVWVPFEPTPPHNATAAPRAEAPDDARAAGLVTGEAAASGGGTAGTGGTTPADDGPVDHPLLSTPALAAYTLLATVVLLAMLLLVMKRLRRRRRRRAPSTAEQVLGAWAEVTDRLLEAGVEVDPAMTAREVVAVSAPLVPATATARLGAMVPHVTVALYSPEPPTPQGAAEMWDLADRFGGEVLDGRPWYSGIVARLNPRPLLGRRTR
jgi:transglutaminase-like putative cysteine protease/heme exporter protein D